MMRQKQIRSNQFTRATYDDVWFETLFAALDTLHDDVCADRLSATAPVAPDEMVGWLEDIIYTAKETISEIRATAPGAQVTEAGRPSLVSGGDYVTPNK